MAANNTPAGAYFEGSRAEIANMVPSACQKVLDVGCGFGGLGRELKKRGFSQLFGIEINPDAGPKLEPIYSQYWISDVEKLLLPEDVGPFDCLIFADVLEHLMDPWGTLQRYMELLRPGGAVIVSIPNVRNIALLYRLVIQGRWDYEEYGLLDRTHLRFFTRDNISDLLQGAGLQIERWEVNRDQYSGLRKIVASIAKMFSSEIDVCQYLVVARKK